MIAYGFPRGDLANDLAIARRLGASTLEILPDWGRRPDPSLLRETVADWGLGIHSVHACWGGRAIEAGRVDLADPDPQVWQASLEDVVRYVDWLHAVGGRILVVHPGGLSDRADAEVRREALARSLARLAEQLVGSGMVVCVENMPPGVYPGSRMAELAEVVAELARPELALALDTGHAHLAATVDGETRAAGDLLRTTHVHDNDGRRDTHDPPGRGTLDWDAWVSSLDRVGYRGPIMLECIRYLRQHPETIDEPFLLHLDRLTHGGRGHTSGTAT